VWLAGGSQSSNGGLKPAGEGKCRHGTEHWRKNLFNLSTMPPVWGPPGESLIRSHRASERGHRFRGPGLPMPATLSRSRQDRTACALLQQGPHPAQQVRRHPERQHPGLDEARERSDPQETGLGKITVNTAQHTGHPSPGSTGGPMTAARKRPGTVPSSCQATGERGRRVAAVIRPGDCVSECESTRVRCPGRIFVLAQLMDPRPKTLASSSPMATVANMHLNASRMSTDPTKR
jgi:hypothetical protein